MCRHLGYLGSPVTLDELVLRPEHSLLEQAWAPRDTRGGATINADGFGVGWYPDHAGTPKAYRMRVAMKRRRVMAGGSPIRPGAR